MLAIPHSASLVHPFLRTFSFQMNLPKGGHRIEEKFGGFKSESQGMEAPRTEV